MKYFLSWCTDLLDHYSVRRRVFSGAEGNDEVIGLVALGASVPRLGRHHFERGIGHLVGMAIRDEHIADALIPLLWIGQVARQLAEIALANRLHQNVLDDHGRPSFLAAKGVTTCVMTSRIAAWLARISSSTPTMVLLICAMPKGSQLRVVGQPEFQQAAHAAKIAIDLRQLLDVLVVQDAVHRVALTDYAQVTRRAVPGRLRYPLDLRFLLGQAIDVDRGASLAGGALFTHGVPPIAAPAVGPARQDSR